jgi:toxin ParE1/3/4
MVCGNREKAQSDSYLEHIKQQLWTLSEHPKIGNDRSELLTGVKSLTIERHSLFYRVTSDRVEIIRVLHGRQDPQRRLK